MLAGLVTGATTPFTREETDMKTCVYFPASSGKSTFCGKSVAAPGENRTIIHRHDVDYNDPNLCVGCLSRLEEYDSFDEHEERYEGNESD